MSSIKKNVIYNTLYQVLAILIPLVTTPYLSRVLGPEAMGEYSFSNAITSYFILFILLGLNSYGNRAIASIRGNKVILSKAFKEIYIMQLICSIFVVIAYIFFAIFFSNTTITWIFLFMIISSVLDINWFFFGIEQFKLTVTRNTIIKLSSTLMIFALVKNEDDLLIYILIMTVSMLLSQISLWFFLPRFITNEKIAIKNVFKHFKPNLILFIPVVAASVYKIMDKVMLGLMANKSHVGFYENSERIINIPIALINSLGIVMLPKISNLVANGKSAESTKYLDKSIYYILLFTAPICFGILSVSDIFVPLFLGDKFYDAIIVLEILLPSCLFTAYANVIRTQYLIPLKKDEIYVKSIVGGAIINFIVNSLLIEEYYSAGAAVGTICAEASVCIYQAYRIRKEIDLKSTLKGSVFIVISVAMAIIIKFVHLECGSKFCELLIKILLGMFIYAACCIPILKRDNYSKSILNSILRRKRK